MSYIASSHCRVCTTETNQVGVSARSLDRPGFDRELAMQVSLQRSLQHASLPNALPSGSAATGLGNNLMSLAQPGLPHANPALRNVFMQAVEQNRDRMAAELKPTNHDTAALHPTAQSGLVHAHPGLRDVFMQAVQNNRDRMAAEIDAPEVAAPEVAPMQEAGAHPARQGLEALNKATRDVLQNAIDRQAEALPVRDMIRDGLLAVIDEIENPSAIAQMRRSHALGPDPLLDINRVEAQMVNHLRDAIALFDRMQEAGSGSAA